MLRTGSAVLDQKTHVSKRVSREARVRPAFAKQTRAACAACTPRAFQAFGRSLDLRIGCTVTSRPVAAAEYFAT
jgi:hypothetical protein